MSSQAFGSSLIIFRGWLATEQVSPVISGCAIYNAGFQGHNAPSVQGSPIVNNVGYGASFVGSGSQMKASASDGVDWRWARALFPGPNYWYATGSITGNVFTVTSFDGGSSPTDPGLAVGQMVRNNGAPVGTFIQATHAEDPTYTGTGHTGTYEVFPDISNPIFSNEAKSGTISGQFEMEVQTGRPLTQEGTTVIACSAAVGSNCGTTGTVTLSSPARLGTGAVEYLLPGPNTNSQFGSQMYNITTSLTGNNYGPFLAGASGSTLTVTSGATNVQLGQAVLSAPAGGGPPASPTTTAALTVGEYASTSR